MIQLFKPKNNIFGLDIGFEALRLVQLKRTGNTVALHGAINLPLTERIIEKDHFKDKTRVAAIVKEACEKAKPNPIKASSIVTALPETFVFAKTIQAPKMEEDEYEEVLGEQISQYLPVPLSDVYVDYQTLIVHPDEPLVDVLFVAAPKRLVDEYVEVAKLTGCELAALETKPLAAGRALISPKSTEGTVIAEIGTEVCRVSIWDGYQIRLTTTVGIGKNQLTKILGESKPGAKPDTLSVYQKEALSPLIEEIAESIRYHQNRDYRPKPIAKVLVCGSGASVPGIVDHIGRDIKVKTIAQKPGLSGKDELSIDFTTAYGLALWNE